MKHISILLLAAIMVLTAIACSAPVETENNHTDTTENSTILEETTIAEKTSESMIEELYPAQNFNGKEFRILAISNNKHVYAELGSDINEVYYEEYTGEILNDAIVDRNRRTEELLNIKIVPVWGGETSDITNIIKNAVTSGSNDFDAVINRMDNLGTSMQNGCLANLKNITTINSEHPWWDANIVDNFTLFNSKLYWISGDINSLDDYAVEVIFFNKNICDDYSLEYPYNSVFDGTWTIEKFYNMAKTVEKDLDGNGKIVAGKDIVGHQENNDHIKHWIYAMGQKTLDINSDGTLEIMTLSENQINAIDRLYQYMVDGEMTYTGTFDTFTQGYALFQGVMLGNINSLRDMEDDFGIIPMPKYDEAQKSYGAYISNGWTTAFAVPLTNTNRDFTGICLETMCAYSTNTVRSSLYDVLLSAKLIRDEETIKMLDIILSSKTYDWAVDFTWGSTFAQAYNNIYNNKTNNYVSAAEAGIKAQTKLIEKLVQSISNLSE